MEILSINGVDITPYIALKGYKQDIEDLDASAERSMAGVLTRDRVARVPIIEVNIIAMLEQEDVSKILNACKPAKSTVKYYNKEVGDLVTADFYIKVKGPNIYSIADNKVLYEGFTISLKGFKGVTYD